MEKNKILSYALKFLLIEIKSWFHFLRTEWILLLIISFFTICFIIYTKPIPPSHIKMVVSSEGSVSEQLGKRFIPYFEKNGVKLELIETDGYGKKLAKIANDDDEIIAGLIVGGISEKEEFKELESYGSMSYAPFWLIYKGANDETGDLSDFLKHKKIAISPKGTSTYILFDKILNEKGIELSKLNNIYQIKANKIQEALSNDTVDAAILVDGFDSPRIQSITKTGNIKIYNLKFTDAYTRKIPYLTEVTIPTGSFEFNKMSYPKSDIKMISSTEILLIDKKTHPAIKELFSEAALKIGKSENQFFSTPGTFPKFNDSNLKRSEEAEKHYKGDKLLMRDKFPLFVSSYIDRVWIIIVGFLSVIIPIVSFLPSYRDIRFKVVLDGYYDKLHQIENEEKYCVSEVRLKEIISELDTLNSSISNEWIVNHYGEQVFNFKNALALVKNIIKEKISNQTSQL